MAEQDSYIIRPPDTIPYLTDEGQEVTLILTSNRTCESDLKTCGSGMFEIGGAALCGVCFNHPTVRCPKCGWREFGRHVDGNEEIQCRRCNHSWQIPDDEVASDLPTR